MARASPLVRGEDLSPEHGLIVLVRPLQWQVLDLENQKALAGAFDCAIARTDYLKEIHFRYELDGDDLTHFSGVDLYEMRRDGYETGPAGSDAPATTAPPAAAAAESEAPAAAAQSSTTPTPSAPEDTSASATVPAND